MDKYARHRQVIREGASSGWQGAARLGLLRPYPPSDFALDAVDGSSTWHVSAMDMGAATAPFGGATNAHGCAITINSKR
jgi:hypothetical protein